MSKVLNTDLLIQAAGRWDPADAEWILETFVRANPGARGSMTMLFQWRGAEEERLHVRVEFSDVQGVRLADLDSGLVQLGYLSIDDITDRGWECIRFHVSDDEGADIDWYCGAIRILSVDPAPFIV